MQEFNAFFSVQGCAECEAEPWMHDYKHDKQGTHGCGYLPGNQLGIASQGTPAARRLFARPLKELVYQSGDGSLPSLHQHRDHVRRTDATGQYQGELSLPPDNLCN